MTPLNSHSKELVFRFSIIALAVTAWVILLLTHTVDGEIQSALDLILGAAVGYHTKGIADSPEGDNNDHK